MLKEYQDKLNKLNDRYHSLIKEYNGNDYMRLRDISNEMAPVMNEFKEKYSALIGATGVLGDITNGNGTKEEQLRDLFKTDKETLKDINKEMNNELVALNDKYKEMARAAGVDDARLSDIQNRYRQEMQQLNDKYESVIQKNDSQLKEINKEMDARLSSMKDHYRAVLESSGGNDKLRSITKESEARMESMIDTYKAKISSGVPIEQANKEFSNELAQLNDRYNETARANGGHPGMLQSITNDIKNEMQQYTDRYSSVLSERKACIDSMTHDYQIKVSAMNEGYRSLLQTSRNGVFHDVSGITQVKLQSYQNEYNNMNNKKYY